MIDFAKAPAPLTVDVCVSDFDCHDCARRIHRLGRCYARPIAGRRGASTILCERCAETHVERMRAFVLAREDWDATTLGERQRQWAEERRIARGEE